MTYYMPFKGGTGPLFPPARGMGMRVRCLRCKPRLAPCSFSRSSLPCVRGPPQVIHLPVPLSWAAFPLPFTPLPVVQDAVHLRITTTHPPTNTTCHGSEKAVMAQMSLLSRCLSVRKIRYGFGSHTFIFCPWVENKDSGATACLQY